MDDIWWTFHDVGDSNCAACAVMELPVCECAGLIHTQFKEELDAIEARCDRCSREDALVEVT